MQETKNDYKKKQQIVIIKKIVKKRLDGIMKIKKEV